MTKTTVRKTGVCPRYADDMPKICQMQKIFPKYAKDIPKISGNG